MSVAASIGFNLVAKGIFSADLEEPSGFLLDNKYD